MPNVFLCHSSQDKPLARQLSQDFEAAGLDVWIDEAELNVGDSLIEKIAEGIEKADCMVAVISSHSVASAWVQKELKLAMTTEILNRRVNVLPVVAEECEIPFFLRDKLYADFRDEVRARDEKKRLIQSIWRLAVGSKAGDSSAGTPQSSDSGQDAGAPEPLGQVVHDVNREYHGYRLAKMYQMLGFISFVAGLLSLFNARLLASASLMEAEYPWYGELWPGLVTVAGLLFLTSAECYNICFDRDKNLLLEYERPKGWAIPYGRRWQSRYWTDRTVAFRAAVCTKTSAFLLILLALPLVLFQYFIANRYF